MTEYEMKIRCITQTCRWQPSQWEGVTECGKYIFIRERHDYLTVDVADNIEDFLEGRGANILTIDDTNTHSYMTKEQMIELTKGVLDFSECKINEMEPF